MIIDQKDIKHEQLFIFTSLFLFLSILESLTSFLLCLLFRLVNLLNFRCIDFGKICRIPEKTYRYGSLKCIFVTAWKVSKYEVFPGP